MSALRTRLVAAALGACLAAACATTREPGPAWGSGRSDKTFFAAGQLDAGRADLDDFRRDWYSSYLRAMGEPSFARAGVSEPAYRFTLLPSFDAPRAVRLETHADGMRLSYVQLDDGGGHEPGKVAVRRARTLDAAHAATLARQFETVLDRVPPDRIGLDGAQWIFESRSGGRHRVIDRWSPEPGPARDLGEALLRGAGSLPPQ